MRRLPRSPRPTVYPDRVSGMRFPTADSFGESFGREKLVNDYHVPPGRVIVLGECAPCKKRRAQRFEIPGHHLLKVRPFGAGQWRSPRLCGRRTSRARTAAQR